MGSIVADFKTLFLANLDDKTSEMTSKFQDVAETYGWESSIASEVTVGPTAINIPETVKTKVEDAEYGSPGNPARAALRKFKPQFRKEMAEAANAAAITALTEDAKELFGR
jgi:hypothetical protein